MTPFCNLQEFDFDYKPWYKSIDTK